MRSTVDLIEELEMEAGNFTHVALAVGFEKTRTFIFADKPDRLQQLNDAVSAGGEPIGFLGIDFHNRILSVQTRTLEEYETEEWAAKYLSALTDEFKSLLKQRYPVAELEPPSC
jgi:hypothetical protein